jgi:hypothetical protein
MPQLDTLSFFTQVFWFILIIVCFYYLMVNKLIPVISNIFKIRNNFKFVKNLEVALSQVSSLDKITNENLVTIKNTQNNNQTNVKNFINSVITKEKEVTFNSGFNAYLSNIGELISKNKF